MKLAALAAAALLAPTVTSAPPRRPDVVTVAVGHERARGFVVGDERVVTVAHVLGGSNEIEGGGNEIVGGGDDGARIVVDGRAATVVQLDRRNDLALLRVPGLEGEAPRLGDGDGTRVLDRPAPIVRHVTARVDRGAPRPALIVRAAVAAGESGAPLVTDSGRVAGVVFARSRTRARTAYAVDAAPLAALLK
jgi:S1-C subfamily serine protease